MLLKVPNVTKYLYVMSQKGWFPIFRILNFFSGLNILRGDQLIKNIIAKRLCEALFKIKYDFTRQSLLQYKDFSQMSTIEILLIVPCDPELFRNIWVYIINTDID